MKIKIGKEKESRSLLDFSHDVHTTSDVGFLQPTCRLEIIPGSTIKIDSLSSYVRLFPVIAPTFGKFTLKHYAAFVPMRDLYMPYDNLMSGTAYAGDYSYIPSQVPYLSIAQLACIVLSQCRYTSWTLSADGKATLDTATNPILPLDVTPQPTVYDYFTKNVVNAPIKETGDKKVTIEGADFTIYGKVGNVEHVIAFKMNKAAKNLRKILLGLGYQLNFQNRTHVNVLPIFAYYKVYFDLFVVKQTINWEQTDAFYILRYIANNNVRNLSDVIVNSEAGSIGWKIIEFFESLSECYYVANPDFFTAHVDTMSKQMTGVTVPFISPDGSYDQVEQPDANLPQVYTDEDYPLSSVQLRLLDKLTKWVNKNTVIGQRIATYMAAHGLGSVDDNKKNYFIGSANIDIDIDAVMSTADTDNADIGDYAGKGVGSGRSGQMKFNADCAGYLIILSTIVPRTGYCQGVSGDLLHTERFDFFNPEFDALGMQITPELMYMCGEDSANYAGGTDSAHAGSFGYIPRYSEYKYKTNVVNGDISLASTRTELLPYTLDRFISPSGFSAELSGTDMKYKYHHAVPIQVNPSLRFLGKDEFFGNFDRIFNENTQGGRAGYRDSIFGTPLEDNFIVHNMFNIKVAAPCKPLSESFDTDEYEHTMSVEKA